MELNSKSESVIIVKNNSGDFKLEWSFTFQQDSNSKLTLNQNY